MDYYTSIPSRKARFSPCFLFCLTLLQWCHHVLDLNTFGEHTVIIINHKYHFYFKLNLASNNLTPTADPLSSVWTASQPSAAPASGQLSASVCVCVCAHVSLHREHKEDTAFSYPVPLLKNEPKGTKSNFVFWFLSSSSFHPNAVVLFFLWTWCIWVQQRTRCLSLSSLLFCMVKPRLFYPWRRRRWPRLSPSASCEY